jgi:hypothetical protein
LEREIVVLDRDEDGTIRLLELDAEGNPLTPGVFVPEALDGAFPKVGLLLLHVLGSECLSTDSSLVHFMRR